MNLTKSFSLSLAEAGKTQKWLAEKLNRSSVQITRWKKANNIRTADLQLVADALNIKPSEFLALGE